MYLEVQVWSEQNRKCSAAERHHNTLHSVPSALTVLRLLAGGAALSKIKDGGASSQRFGYSTTFRAKSDNFFEILFLFRLFLLFKRHLQILEGVAITLTISAGWISE